MVVIALSLTQITTPILVIAETSEADQPAETISKIDKEKILSWLHLKRSFLIHFKC